MTEAELELKAAEQQKALLKAIDACTALDQGRTQWQFTLSDGITAKVMFHGGPPDQRHLAAFVKIFAAVADNYVVPPDPTV